MAPPFPEFLDVTVKNGFSRLPRHFQSFLDGKRYMISDFTPRFAALQGTFD
jgi:hypothetical protein